MHSLSLEYLLAFGGYYTFLPIPPRYLPNAPILPFITAPVFASPSCPRNDGGGSRQLAEEKEQVDSGLGSGARLRSSFVGSGTSIPRRCRSWLSGPISLCRYLSPFLPSPPPLPPNLFSLSPLPLLVSCLKCAATVGSIQQWKRPQPPQSLRRLGTWSRFHFIA